VSNGSLRAQGLRFVYKRRQPLGTAVNSSDKLHDDSTTTGYIQGGALSRSSNCTVSETISLDQCSEVMGSRSTLEHRAQHDRPSLQ